MSALVVYPTIGFAAIVCACFAHDRICTRMVRAKFVALTLLTLGSVALCYVAIWVLAMQHPMFSLRTILGFGLTMWATMAVYCTVVVLCKRDIAPST